MRHLSATLALLIFSVNSFNIYKLHHFCTCFSYNCFILTDLDSSIRVLNSQGSATMSYLSSVALRMPNRVAAAAAKSLQSCPTLCDPIDGSSPGSPVPGILQARTLKWVAISFSNAWEWKVKVKSLGRVQLLATPWTAAYQAPPPMGFSRQEY